MKTVITTVFCLSIFNYINAQQKNKYYDEKALFEIENQFSKTSQEKGFRMATILYSADSSIVFRPRMMNTKEWADNLKNQDSSYVITWYPSLIEMSASGDLGYATGPFDNVSTIPGDSSANHGQFVTVWKKQADGSLKFIMDFGSGPLSGNEFVKKEPIFKPALTGPKKYKKVNKEESLNQILLLEKEIDKECETNGDLKAYEKFADDDIRFFYQRQFYTRGLNNVKARLEKQTGKPTWIVLNTNIAESGDLAHVYGKHEFKDDGKIKTGYYMRIWKKQADGKWTLVVQVRNLL